MSRPKDPNRLAKRGQHGFAREYDVASDAGPWIDVHELVRSHPVTPAMAAGVTNTLWSLGDLVAAAERNRT